MQWI
jgi:MFS family permease